MSGGISPVDDFARATLDEYVQSSVQDQYFDKFNLLGWLESRVGVTKRYGGDNLVVPINIDENDQGGSYQGLDIFANTMQESLRNAYFKYAKYQWPIAAEADQILRNKGRAGIIDLWMNKADLALESMRKRINADAFLDGTGNGGKNLDGLGIAVDSTGTYGTIARATITQWAANEAAVGGALALEGAVGMNHMFNEASLGSGDASEVGAIITTQAITEEYESLMAENIRYTSVQAGDASFGRLLYKGRPFIWDRAAPTGIMWFLTPDTFELVVHPDRNWRTLKMRSPEDGTAEQDAYLQHILLWIQLIGKEARRNGKLTGIT
jgi:hypothetical protein